MTVTIHLPQQVEQAYRAAAQSKGVSLDALVSDVLLSHAPAAESEHATVSPEPRLVEQHGVAVLWTGHPIAPSVVSDTLDLIRRERDLTALGQF